MLLCSALLCCAVTTSTPYLLYLEHLDCRPRRSINDITSITAVIWCMWCDCRVMLNLQDRPLIDGLRSSFPWYASRRRFSETAPWLVKSPSQTSTHHLAPSISSPLLSSLVFSQANSIRKYPRTHTACKIIFASLLT